VALQANLSFLNEAAARFIGGLVEPKLSIAGSRGEATVRQRGPVEGIAFNLMLEGANLASAKGFLLAGGPLELL